MHGIGELEALLRGRRIAVLSGAGLSTESGIPDYRGPETRRRARQPIQYKEFISSDAIRRRYWARSTIGWPRMRNAAPNDGHRAVAALEASGRVHGVITQNVDRLHARAGSHAIELHGALQEVLCLSCKVIEDRDVLQQRLLAANPGFSENGDTLPDGDAELADDTADRFEVPACEQCGGVLKPHVVYFGESVPRDRVERAYAVQDAADVLLVLGSSLQVFSGYRFVLRAAERKQPIAIVNLEPSRGDALATVRVAAKLGDVLPTLQRALV